MFHWSLADYQARERQEQLARIDRTAWMLEEPPREGKPTSGARVVLTRVVPLLAACALLLGVLAAVIAAHPFATNGPGDNAAMIAGLEDSATYQDGGTGDCQLPPVHCEAAQGSAPLDPTPTAAVATAAEGGPG